MNKDKFTTALAVFIMISVILLVATITLKVMLQYDFDRAEEELTADVSFTSELKLQERPYHISLFPWSRYHKHSTHELSEEELAFLQEKKVAECMVDMINYDEILIQDKDVAVSQIYNNARKLLTDEDKVYYVWNEFPLENIYLYTMINLKGEIFSFRYVTDTEYDEQEAIDYVMDNYEDDKITNLPSEESGDFEKNRKKFVKNAYEKLAEYQNLDTKIFYEDADFLRKPVQISKESGNVLIEYPLKSEEDVYIFLYLDSKTKKCSGYHLMLY